MPKRLSSSPLVVIGSFSGLVSISVYFYWKFTNQRKKTDAQFSDYNQEKQVSKRGLKASTSSPLPYFASYLEAIANPCHPTENRDGYISLCVAENKLILSEFAKKLSQPNTAKVGFGNEVNYCYNDVRGMQYVRKSVAQFITKRFIQGSTTSNIAKITNNNETERKKEHNLCASEDQIVLGSGAAAILNFLFHCTANENEVVLIPAPYYAAFEYDMSIIAKCVPYPVHMEDQCHGPTRNDLEKVYCRLIKEGKTVRVLLLTNPNNPLGVIYSPSVMKDCIEWARSKNMHTIVDEIYALSVHKDVSLWWYTFVALLICMIFEPTHLILLSSICMSRRTMTSNQ